MHLSEQERVRMCICARVAGGLSDEISASGSVQDDLGTSCYKGMCFRARGISNADNVLALSAFYRFYITSCETWERSPLLRHRGSVEIYGFLTPGFECVTILLLCCVHRDSVFIFLPIKASLWPFREIIPYIRQLPICRWGSILLFLFIKSRYCSLPSLCLTDREISLWKKCNLI